jgi:hypothetical protein
MPRKGGGHAGSSSGNRAAWAERAEQKLVENAVVFDLECLAERDARAGSQVASMI